MSKSIAVLKAMPLFGVPSEEISKALMCWEDSPLDSANSSLKTIYERHPSEFVENIRIALLEFESNPKQSLNLILKALETLPQYSTISELRKGFLAFEDNADLDALNHFLRYFCDSDDQGFINEIRKSIQKFPEANWEDAFSFGQIQSKLWLIEEWTQLQQPPAQMAYILGGWYGLLAAFAEARNEPLAEKYRSFDIDATCTPIAEAINKTLLLQNWKFKATTLNMHDIDYQQHDYITLKADGSEVRLIETPDLIINTSCEHIAHFSDWYGKLPGGVTLILQSNDFFDEETHINCSKSLNDFKALCQMNQVFFEGEKQFPLYRRFMIIGQK